MLNKFLKTYLIATALSPICISLCYVFTVRDGFWPWGFCMLATAVVLGWSSIFIIRAAKKNLEKMRIGVKKAKSAGKDVIGFFIAYVLPLFFSKAVSVDLVAMFIIVALLAFVIWGTHSVQVNPLLGIFGYHFYEVESDDGITYLLVTKRKIVNVKSVSDVVQLTEYLILDMG